MVVPRTYLRSSACSVTAEARTSRTSPNLQHNKYISRSQQHVLAEILTLDEFRIIDSEKRAVFTAIPNDHDFCLVREVGQSACDGDGLQNRNLFLADDDASFQDSPGNVDLIALDRLDGNSNVRNIHV